MFPVTELIDELDDTTLYGVSVSSVLVNKRFDFVKFMWEKKTYYRQYAYVQLETEDELKNYFVEEFSHAVESEEAAIDSILDFSIDRYDEDEVEDVLTPLTWYEDYLGDSSTLLIMLTLIGMHEHKPWIHSSKKIAITGSLDEDGNVLPVGLVNLKAIAAEKNDADIFIVPKEHIDEAYELVGENTSLTIVGVETIEETIEWLDNNVRQ